MFDFRACLELIQIALDTKKAQAAKAQHKPTLTNVDSMVAYSQAMQTTGQKAVFIKPELIEYFV